ncbi:MAG TPA: hypothetical protein VGP82_03050 [Ktedonobacterales bacterium]|nr:hypothetical protein [Ktedonobacterales bacterium]
MNATGRVSFNWGFFTAFLIVAAGWPLQVAATALGLSTLVLALLTRSSTYLAGGLVGIVLILNAGRPGLSTGRTLSYAVLLAAVNVLAAHLME